MIEGKVFKYGDNINTDVIFAGKYTYTVTERSEMAKHALEDLDPDFIHRVEPGDVIVGGTNFGCGSSREQAAICLKEAGVGAIIAKSFARIFFRNAINEGLPVIVCAAAVEQLNTADRISLDLQAGILYCRQHQFSFPSLPDEVRGILAAGGLIPYVRNSLALKGESR
jgi:3-isopropylmalate/(R)-2-methylmalate dehydratase small subunit